MPYHDNHELPDSVRHALPSHAQNIYREAFNHAFEAHKNEARREEASHRIAWAAVKCRYAKTAQGWMEKPL
jgi:cation transport regulator